jgi:hypothetical protein
LPAPKASKFRAKISLNDFTGYTTATQAVLTKEFTNVLYNIVPTELSAPIENLGIFRGNYWGTSCSQGLAPGAIKPPNLTITDKHPFGQRVAGFPGLTPCR